MRILALSSSRTGKDEYLQTASLSISDFLGTSPSRIAFIPFASADNDYEAYADKVREGLPQFADNIVTVTPSNAKKIIESTDVIMIGGGNSFKLLHDLYAIDLVQMIKEKVQGGTPYIGWSAGANLTGPTISTTNDMPIIQPKSFASFGFFPFQINPHYYNAVTEGFNGETRDQRLEEFLKLNNDKMIACLPEGTALLYQKQTLQFFGNVNGYIMKRENGETIKRQISPGDSLTHLISLKQ